MKLQRTIKRVENKKPERCGECDRYSADVYDSDNKHMDGVGYCLPIKPKYGCEIVNANQKPSVNCPLKETK